MTTGQLNVVRGTNNKPEATRALVEDLAEHRFAGHLLIGYPVMATPDGRYTIDALLASPQLGLVCFDLIEGPSIENFRERQDDAFTRLYARLLAHRDLVRNRQLQTAIHTVSYAPAVVVPPDDHDFPVVNTESIGPALSRLTWHKATPELYERTLSAIHNMTAIRRPGGPRHVESSDSRGAKLDAIEDSIATLDRRQSKAVIETVDGVQRIRGIAGSGKTIVLALKAAYLHAQHPSWRMAVTFHTRSLKDQFKRLITKFTIEQTGMEPDWDQLRIVNSWGAPGPPDRDGIYHEFCQAHGIPYLDFIRARNKFGGSTRAFRGAVQEALTSVTKPIPLYNAILVDEAQDFSPAFLRLCYEILDEPKRLVYAYDELQNLTSKGLPPAEEIFGSHKKKPRVTLSGEDGDLDPSRDIILQKCYRNSRPALVCAHGLGFGIYRTIPENSSTGLVQMFSQPELWTDIGYSVREGRLDFGEHVSLSRSTDTSPSFLEDHSPLEDLIMFRSFSNEKSQAEWVADQIENNLKKEELRYDDIIVINTDPITARSKLGAVRKALLDRKIASHLAGVDTPPDVFFRNDSITCTGVFRAKGNEAAMVYVINADESHTSSANLSRVRNRLFTAITRSKAWVRVAGIGDDMDQLLAEYRRIQDAEFQLSFRYPTKVELDRLTIVHRDMSADEERRVRDVRQSLTDLVRDLRQGELYLEDFDEDDIHALLEMLSRSQGFDE